MGGTNRTTMRQKTLWTIKSMYLHDPDQQNSLVPYSRHPTVRSSTSIDQFLETFSYVCYGSFEHSNQRVSIYPCSRIHPLNKVALFTIDISARGLETACRTLSKELYNLCT